MKTAETANPNQYLRLLLLRLLETQKALYPLLASPSLAPVRLQYQINEFTLSEIQSWLRAAGGTSPLGPSPSSALTAAESGEGSFAPPPPASITAGTLENPFAWTTSKTPRLTESQVRSSLPSSAKLPESASISSGRVIFRPPSFPTKPSNTSDGPPSTSVPPGSGD